MKIVPTKIIENFFSESELNDILELHEKYKSREGCTMAGESWMPKGFIENKVFAMWHDKEPEYRKCADALLRNTQKHFGPDLQIASMHILTAYWPYRAHGDAVFGEYGIDNNHYGAYTFVIPLDDYESHTITFNEYSFDTKFVPEYIKDKQPIDKIDRETYLKYLSHEAESNMRYFSIDKVFKWKRNTCFAQSRYKFHGSDDFYSHGLPCKKGIIVWTYAKNEITFT